MESFENRLTALENAIQELSGSKTNEIAAAINRVADEMRRISSVDKAVTRKPGVLHTFIINREEPRTLPQA